MDALIDDLTDRTDVAENVVQFLRRSFTEIESRQRNLDLARESVVERMLEIEFLRESYEKGLKDLEEKELEFCSFKEGKKRRLAVNNVRVKEEKLDEQLVLLREQIERLEVDQRTMQWRMHEKLKEIKIQEEKLMVHRESLAEREVRVEEIIERLDERVRAVEERENAINFTVERKMREMVLKEEQLSCKWQEFVKEIRLADVKFMEQEKLKIGLTERLKLAEYKLESMRERMDESLKEIESRESVVRESVGAAVKQADLIRELLEKELSEFEKMKRVFESFPEEKMLELVSKEEQLNAMSIELAEDAKLRDAQLTEQEKLWNQLLRRLELEQGKMEDLNKMVHERFAQIGLKELELKSMNDWVQRKMDEIDSRERELKEFEKMKREFHSFQEGKMHELVAKEEQLNEISKELVKYAEWRGEQLTKEEKLGNQLLKRFESAQDKVKGLNKLLHERFKQIGAKEIDVQSLSDWVEKKMDEVDLKGIELEEKENILLKREGNLITEEKKLHEKLKKLHLKKKNLKPRQKAFDLKKKNLNSRQKKLDLKEKNLESRQKELDLKEKNVESWQNELEMKRKEVDLALDLNERRLEELDRKEKNLNSLKEFTSKCFKEHLSIKKQLLLEKDLAEKRARDLDLNESADLKFVLRMDGKTLQMFLNDPEKDLESMDDEIFKVLHLSSDPAKLVLDAMVGFYPPRLRKGDVELNVRKTCIILLEQLFRMSKKIQPGIKEEAMELANSWKSKMGANGENPLEVLGFLHLLAAYNLSSYFDKNEILSFLMMVAQYRQRTQLCRVLGFTDSFAD